MLTIRSAIVLFDLLPLSPFAVDILLVLIIKTAAVNLDPLIKDHSQRPKVIWVKISLAYIAGRSPTPRRPNEQIKGDKGLTLS